MVTKEEINKLYKERELDMLVYGLEHDLIALYDEDLIKNMRLVKYGGIPASIILLSNKICNGYCYDRARLLAEVLINMGEDVNLIHADVDSLRYSLHAKSPEDFEHCFVERITKDGSHLIYDTSSGLCYDKDYYWKMENPKVRLIRNKDEIIEFIKSERKDKVDDSASMLIIPFIEDTINDHDEFYTTEKIPLLKREIDLYKESIKYDELEKEVYKHMKRVGM